MFNPVFLGFLYVFLCAEGGQAEPTIAVITAETAMIRSGPGKEFYPVLQLQAGDNVEIYYRQGEWFALRPPIGSFSWVSADYIQLGTGNVGTVLVGGLAARIGSDFSDDCGTVQVTLNKGETVMLLERREIPENSASPTWLKIAPPSGEFRWVHQSAFGAGDVKESGIRQNVQQVRYDAEGFAVPFEVPEPIRQLQSSMSDDVMSGQIPNLPTNAPPANAVPSPSLTEPRVASAHFPTLNSSSTTPQVTLRTMSGVPVTDPFQRAFHELQRETYVVMTRPTDDEVFAMLIQRAHELHQIAPTDFDLEKTYHLLESLQRTRAVRRELAQRRAHSPAVNRSFAPQTFPSLFPRRTDNSPPTTTPALASTAQTPALLNQITQNQVPPNQVAQIPAAHNLPVQNSVVQSYIPTSAHVSTLRAGVNVGGFDVVGRLGEFESPPHGHPPYAVADEEGKIICLITPSMGVDLSSSVGLFVGINGVLGLYEKKPGESRARHISARNVQRLR